IISDIFLRFEYMDRRGSGINRIMKDYSDCPVKPAFFSESSWFRVSMPNRNVVFQEKTSISEGESALLSEKTSIFHEKVSISDEKASILKDDSGFLEEQRFALQIRELADIRGKTRERIMVLRRLYNFEIGFTRLDIMKEFGVTERQASRLLSILFKHELIEKVKTGEYVFKRFEE
ncbi:MAG: hypothetical protein Q4G69_14400, partial [Planctomycetia bacterium]|nr:hypothetical protein [Planctomycetia bacterium]